MTGQADPRAFPRIVLPEWLDDLPADDPRALASRRDLVVLNAVMLQTRIMANLLRRLQIYEKPVRILEIGSGDGRFMLAAARRLSRFVPAAEVFLLDRKAALSADTLDGFARIGWRASSVEADVFDYLRTKSERFDAVSANLFLHHFSPEALQDLMALAAARCDLFCACEPRRDLLSLAGSRMVWALGCNDVTRHDAVVSVRAGFNGAELSGLWPQAPEWSLVEKRAGPFTHVFCATRTPPELTA